MQLSCIIAYKHDLDKRVWGGDKNEEMPRVRKDFEQDIARPLGPLCFRRVYRMRKDSFYILFSFLRRDLASQFYKSHNTTFKKRKQKTRYYIDLKIRLSAALRFLQEGIP